MLQLLKESVSYALKECFQVEIIPENIKLETTSSNFEGDYTFIVFPFVKMTKKTPEATATVIGNYLIQQNNLISSFNVVKGFLNIIIKDQIWFEYLSQQINKPDFSLLTEKKRTTILIEFSSPNTNKPMHLGHIRNNLIGNAVANILELVGNKVVRVNLINDRGIHICKTMLAWIKWEHGNTPEKLKVKGDKYVGDLYVKFEQELNKELKEIIASGVDEQKALEKSVLMNEAREILRKWEGNDSEIRNIWQMMNSWVYDGFNSTYQRMGIRFDKIYHESETYLLGKEIILNGLQSGCFIQKEDTSVWVDLREQAMDEKILLRSDGTSVYITQDIGTAVLRYNEWKPDKMVYVVGNEQNYHFQVLKLTLEKLGYEFSKEITHLSYGMVELPDGKMKSREGRVVDADELMDEMYETALQISMEAGKAIELDEDVRRKVIEQIAQGALKYFILRVDAAKNMVFHPDESVDFNGNTGPFVQYTHARIKSLLKKTVQFNTIPNNVHSVSLHPTERQIIRKLYVFPSVIEESASALNPSVIAQYVYELSADFNTFYQQLSVLREENKEVQSLRILMSAVTAQVIEKACSMLGIELPGIM